MSAKIKYIMPFIKILILLFLIQTFQSVLVYLIPTFISNTSVVRDSVEILSFIVIGAVLFLIAKPNKESLSLNFNKTKKAGGVAYTLSTLAVLFIAAQSFAFEGFSYASITRSLLSVIIIPVFEELLFRGYIWSFLKKYLKNELTVFIAVTVLFAIWHLGYIDDILYRTSEAGIKINIFNEMFYKIITVAVLGAVIGFVKMKAKNTYAGILVHIIINVFGR